jgi:hypothetical protein
VPTATFRVLYVFFVLSHDRRRVLHFNVTEFPSAQWTGQQIIEAFPEDTAPRSMIRDRDGIYGDQFRGRVEERERNRYKGVWCAEQGRARAKATANPGWRRPTRMNHASLAA